MPWHTKGQFSLWKLFLLFCQQEKSFLKKSPKEVLLPLHPSCLNTKRKKSSQSGERCCGGDGQRPCLACWPKDPFASDSLVTKRPHLIRRGRNDGFILFPCQVAENYTSVGPQANINHCHGAGCTWGFVREHAASLGVPLFLQLACTNPRGPFTSCNGLQALILSCTWKKPTLAGTAISA